MFAVMWTLHFVPIEAYAEDTDDSCSVAPTSPHDESYSSNSTQNVDELLQVSKTYGSKNYQLHTAYHSWRFCVSEEDQKYFQGFSFLRVETCIINQSRKARWSGDVMKRPGRKNFIAVSHKRARPEVLFSTVAVADLVGSTWTFTLCIHISGSARNNFLYSERNDRIPVEL